MLALSVAAMFIASLLAIFEQNVKRMLAYSSLGQIGYITLGISLANEAGLTGGIVHLFNHAVMKAALFLVLGAIVYRIGSVKLADLAGIGRQMPLTMAAFVVAGLAIIGTPGTAGFISKWYLAVGAFQKGWWPLVFLILASSMLAMVYIGRVVEVAWFREPSALAQKARDPPLSMLVPVLLLAAATIYFGFDTQASAGIASQARTRPARRAQMIPPLEPRHADAAGDRHPICRRGPDPAVSPLAEPARAGHAVGRRHARACGLEPGRSGARWRAAGASCARDRSGVRAGLRDRAARHAVRAGCRLAVARQFDLLDRLHARQRRAAPDLLLRLLCGRARRHHGDRIRQEPRHAVPVLRAADAVDLSARRPQGQRGGHPGRPALSRPAARFLHGAVAAGDLRHLAARRHDRLQGRRHSARPK